MHSDYKSNNILSSYEEVHENLFILYGKLHSQVIPSIQRYVGSVADLDAIRNLTLHEIQVGNIRASHFRKT